MKTIYVVTEGQYSDYHINAVFDSEELARKYIKSIGFEPENDDPYAPRIETYELNPNKDQLHNNLKVYEVIMDKQGNTKKVEHSKPHGLIGLKMVAHWFTHTMGTAVITCYARDEQHAVKIANERRTQLIANNEW